MHVSASCLANRLNRLKPDTSGKKLKLPGRLLGVHVAPIIAPLATLFATPLPLNSQAQTPPSPRPQIQQPAQDCNFLAADNPRNFALERACARHLQTIGQMLRHSAWQNTCEGDVLPDLRDLDAYFERTPDGREIGTDRLLFLPLGKGRFLIALACNQGAYNTSYLVFTYEETPHPAPPRLLWFPEIRYSGRRAHVHYTAQVTLRDFDPATCTLYHYAKYLGDGSGGSYAEYAIDPHTFTPRLKVWISKEETDHMGSYQFARGRRPHAKGWQTYASPVQGRLADITSRNAKR